MKLAWMSNAPWAATGYGNQTKLFVPRIKKLGHEPTAISFYGLEGGLLNWNGIPVYPKGHHVWGNDVGAAHTRNNGAHVLITLMDAWVVEPDAVQRLGVKWIPWYPVDMEPLPPAVFRQVKRAYRRIVFSRFGERMTHDAGLDCYYVPHGVETNVYKPIDRDEAKKLTALPADKFVVGTVAANKGNPSRKALPEQLKAFALFHQKHPDTCFYMHSMKAEHGEGQGVNLPELCGYLGLEVGVDVIFPNEYPMMIGGYTDDYMNALYNSFDVFLLPSMGEGFGIPILEAQAAGCPVIVGDWTAMSELCWGGWALPKHYSKVTGYPPIPEDDWWTPLAADQFMPRKGDIVQALESAWRKSGDSSLRKKAVAGAAAYDADLVAEQCWKPVLADIEQAVGLWVGEK